MRRATLKSRAASATDEPPYFWTTSPPLTEASAPEGYKNADSSGRDRIVLVDQAAEEITPLDLWRDLHQVDAALLLRYSQLCSESNAARTGRNRPILRSRQPPSIGAKSSSRWCRHTPNCRSCAAPHSAC